MINVAAYCRVSTDKEDQKNSLESQKSFFFDYISKNKEWNLVNIYADESISGTNTKKRKQFNKMIRDAENGEIDLIITKEVSRFARNTVDTLEYVRRLKKSNVYVYFINDNINTQDNDGEFRLTIMASVAQEESRKTSERVKWGQRRRMEQGVVFGNKEMLGFFIEDGKISINPEEVGIVKSIFHKFLIEGKGTHIIANELREEGIKPKRNAKEWSSVMILRVLRNEKYVGDLCQGKQITTDYLSHSRVKNDDISSMVYIKNNHEAIIDRDMWDATQKELERRSPSSEIVKKYSNRYWCSGLIKCGYCESSFAKKHYSTKINKRASWVCRRMSKHGKNKIVNGEQVGCDNKSFNDIALRTCCNYVLEQIVENENSIIEHIVKQLKKVQDYVIAEEYTESDIPMLKKSIQALELKKEKAMDMLLSNVFDQDEFTQMKDRYSNEIFDLQSKILEIETSSKTKNDTLYSLETIINRVKDVVNNKGDSDMVLKTIIEEITATRDYMTFKIKNIPFDMTVKYRTRGIGEKYEVIIEEFNLSNDDK